MYTFIDIIKQKTNKKQTKNKQKTNKKQTKNKQKTLYLFFVFLFFIFIF
jgi:hypothetical protein